jgi:hypothetical protein
MHCKHSPALTTTTAGREIVMATPSYRERMKAARAEASAQRKAQQYAELRQRELVYEVRKLAMEAVVAGIKGRGDRVQVYSRAQLTAMANASISAFLIEQARARIASRTGHILGQSATTAPQQGEVSQ